MTALRLLAGVLAACAAASTLAVAQAVAAPDAPSASTVTLFNRPVVTFRAPFMGVSPRDRSDDAAERLRNLLGHGGPGVVSVSDVPQGTAVLVDGQIGYVVTADDARGVAGESARTIAEASAKQLERVAAETREARDSSFLFGAAWRAAIATLLWLLALALARAVWRATERFLTRLADRHAARLRVGGGLVFSRRRVLLLVRRIASLVAIATMILLTWEWLGYVLGLFPYTRPWSEELSGFLVGAVVGTLESIARGLPSLSIAILIFAIAWMVSGAMGRFFDRVESGAIAFAGLDRDTAPPTRRLALIALWCFAAAMAYPYIPGSQTDAFKGLSVLLGLMVSVGASSIVGQAASGLILMYTRTFRSGEYVRIGDREGTVVRMGLFTTAVRTGLGEELTLPNAQVLATVTTNYSRPADVGGFVVTAKVSIGYDAPWRQVHAMLAEAARRTEGVAARPEPQVFQTALDDFYVQYRLACQSVVADPVLRAGVVSALHASIQDVFNENGVQIMSPHYLGDPGAPKVVPKARWHAPPAPPA